MPAKGKRKAVKAPPQGGKAQHIAVHAGGSTDLAAEVKRLAREVEAIKAVLSQRPGGGHDGGAARRDQDKVVADRLARLDEKVEAVWNRVADLEERLEGEGAGGQEADDFEDTPEKDFYER
jgi:hypothetical protein